MPFTFFPKTRVTPEGSAAFFQVFKAVFVDRYKVSIPRWEPREWSLGHIKGFLAGLEQCWGASQKVASEELGNSDSSNGAKENPALNGVLPAL